MRQAFIATALYYPTLTALSFWGQRRASGELGKLCHRRSVRRATIIRMILRESQMNLHHKLLYVAMALVLTPGTLLAADQDTASPNPSSQNPASQNPIAADKKAKNLDTISVTATKRETPLQKTPVAVSAITPDTLDKERVMTVQDLTKLVPGLQGTSEGDHGVVTLTLRGIGNDSAKTGYADPEVATFVDGVYAPRAEAASGLLLDMDGVEVLRGPQGTLWGRNSTAGAISFQTAKPDIGAGFYGNAQVEAG